MASSSAAGRPENSWHERNVAATAAARNEARSDGTPSSRNLPAHYVAQKDPLLFRRGRCSELFLAKGWKVMKGFIPKYGMADTMLDRTSLSLQAFVTFVTFADTFPDNFSRRILRKRRGPFLNRNGPYDAGPDVALSSGLRYLRFLRETPFRIVSREGCEGDEGLDRSYNLPPRNRPEPHFAF